MLSALELGPLTVGIDASSFQLTHYASGVFDPDSCGTQLNHAVLIVGHGYDERTGKPYWRVKNSWGDRWGEAGYIRIARGRNCCGIANLVAFPVWRQGSAYAWMRTHASARACAYGLAILLILAVVLCVGCAPRLLLPRTEPAAGRGKDASARAPGPPAAGEGAPSAASAGAVGAEAAREGEQQLSPETGSAAHHV